MKILKIPHVRLEIRRTHGIIMTEVPNANIKSRALNRDREHWVAPTFVKHLEFQRPEEKNAQ